MITISVTDCLSLALPPRVDVDDVKARLAGFSDPLLRDALLAIEQLEERLDEPDWDTRW